jgi:hypothetical protein
VQAIAGFSQGLPNSLYHIAKRASAGAIANESFVVFKFNVIAVDIDGRQTTGAMRGDRRRNRRISHLTSPRMCQGNDSDRPS